MSKSLFVNLKFIFISYNIPRMMREEREMKAITKGDVVIITKDVAIGRERGGFYATASKGEIFTVAFVEVRGSGALVHLQNKNRRGVAPIDAVERL